MKTIQIDDTNEQAIALINYLRTLPYINFIEKDFTETESNIIKEIPVDITITPKENEIQSPKLIPEKEIPKEKEISETPHFFGDIIEKRILSDLKKAISLNDKFRFQRDLFNGNANEMNEVLDFLNRTTTFTEAWNYLESKYHWNMENDSVSTFKQLLEKRFF